MVVLTTQMTPIHSAVSSIYSQFIHCPAHCEEKAGWTAVFVGWTFGDSGPPPTMGRRGLTVETIRPANQTSRSDAHELWL